MSAPKWIVRRDPDPSPEFPWYYTWTGECLCGGHYGSRETWLLAIESIAAEWADHLASDVGPAS